MTTQILSFGKFKGKRFCDTPTWYQEWLSKQEWFNKPTSEPIPPKRPASWDGYGRRGQTWYDEHFEFEKKMDARQDKSWEWMYEGI